MRFTYNNLLVRFFLIFFIIAFAVIMSSYNPVKADVSILNKKDNDFLLLYEQIKFKKFSVPDSLINSFSNHVLYNYLVYYDSINKIKELDYKDFSDALAVLRGSSLEKSFKNLYFNYAAKKGNWSLFDNLSFDDDFSLSMKCNYYQFHLINGSIDDYSQEVLKLWQSSNLNSKSCAKLSEYILKKVSDDQLWNKAVILFKNHKLTRLRKISKLFKNKDYRKYADFLVSAYKKPKLINSFLKKKSSLNYLELSVLDLSLSKLIKRNDFSVKSILEEFLEKEIINKSLYLGIKSKLVYKMLVERDLTYRDYFDEYLLNNHNSYPNHYLEKRLRIAIFEKNYKDIIKFYDLLNKENKENFAYWRAIAFEKLKDDSAYRNVLNIVSQDRDFYGFLASQHLGKQFSLNFKNVDYNNAYQDNLERADSIVRIKKLKQLNLYLEARKEWSYLMNAGLKIDQLALFAFNNKWINLSIEASIKGKIWDFLNVRFPVDDFPVFNKFADQHNLSVYDLLAIARKESAFNLMAQSRYAMGIMQVTPSTAKFVARKIGVNLKNINNLFLRETNIKIGSFYYKHLLKKYNNNRILALASYNAGPTHLSRWLKESNKKLTAAEFIETIPFLETRNYIKSVLVYSVIYSKLHNDDKNQILTSNELQFKY